MAELPQVTADFLTQALSDYEHMFQTGTEDQFNAAKLRLVWALSHSTDRKHNARAVEMADEMLRELQKVPSDCTAREVQYMKAVALFRIGSYVKCRQQCRSILKESPESRQVSSLKDAAEDALVREGMIGLGVGLTGVVGIAAALAIAAVRR